MLYDANSDGTLSFDEICDALKRSNTSNNIFSLFGNFDEISLVNVMVESIFEAAGVGVEGCLTIELVQKAYRNDSSVLSKFCGC